MRIIIYILILIIFSSISLPFSGKGSGTKDDPYQITNVSQLQEIKDEDNAQYKLMNDIDASETRYWNVADHDGNPNTPDESMGFEPIISSKGLLDGNGYIIYNLYITGRYSVGGLVGRMEGGLIEKCFTHGKVTSTDTLEWGAGEIGGFCGIKYGGFIENCYSSCTVTSVGEVRDYLAGSFCGDCSWGIEDCYTTGKVISQRKPTAFGENEPAEFCYWDVEATGIPDDGSHLAKGYSTSDMMKQATYKGFDFNTIWCIDEGRDYPKLRVFQNKCPPDVFPKDPFIDVSSCDFGELTINETATDSVIIKNTGKEELIITGMKGPSQSSVFTAYLYGISEATPLRLAPEQSFTFAVHFKPTEEKSYTDTIFFISNSVKTFNPDSTAELYGTGIQPQEPEINVTDGNFYTVKAGSKDTATLIIKNTGDNILSVSGYKLNQNSFFKPFFSREISDSNQLILQPDESFSFDIEFHAPDTIAKSITDSLVFSSNAVKGDSISVLSVDSVVTRVADSQNIDNSIELYPNPTFSSIDVVFKLQSAVASRQSLGNVKIIITNSFGLQVYNTNVNNVNSEQEQRHSIDISTFSNGLYFVTLRSPAVALTKGVVVVK